MSCKWYNLCPLRRYERQGRISGFWADNYCKAAENWKNCKRFQQSQNGVYHPDNMMPDGTIDESLDN
ncbi:hypothetical protein SMSP2_00580 [Limihaloglobus sulfuriphilus]|uniref:Uracil-DNA glycosylase n=1 Tax=Limihaloglobus sulfuriphilus TaxID=1851148 RepID=A0A1Q2MD48_9BACT|nr:uracil-DNA glycosylase [Limihaloglobus sulfuriphilus]AQQ70237.1 hypothetical protein SMSP2_00580 [Limihaloglobus sulfuriphilus]